MAEVLVERLRAAGVEIDDPERWTVEAADDVGDGPDAGPSPLTLEVDAWIGAVRRRPAGRPPPTGRADVEVIGRTIVSFSLASRPSARPLGGELPGLRRADFIDRLREMAHDVELVEHLHGFAGALGDHLHEMSTPALAIAGCLTRMRRPASRLPPGL